MIVIPPKSDAARPYHVMDKSYKPAHNQKVFLLKFLGNRIYKLRQRKHDSNGKYRIKPPLKLLWFLYMLFIIIFYTYIVEAVLKSLPKGYHFQYKNGNYNIVGHPSKLRFSSASNV
jgi:hypothetical protein